MAKTKATTTKKAKRLQDKANQSKMVGLPAVGSLAGRAFLVDLTQHYWFGHTRDVAITDEVNKKYDSDGSYDKRLIPTSEMKEMGSRFTDVRRIHQRWTLPWSSDGWRIISSSAYYNWEKELRAAIHLADKAADEFAAKYEALVKERAKVDKSFKPEQYPTKQQIRAKYGFDVHVKPVPQGSDLRVDITDEALAALRASIDSDQQDRIKTALLDLANRVKDTVGKMVERLKEYKPAKGDVAAANTFKDSLILNVRDLAELLPAINVTGSMEIDIIAADIAKLVAVEPNVFRDDEQVRKTTVEAASKILERVSEFI